MSAPAHASCGTTHVGIDEFQTWASTAKPGAKIAYCTGDLASGRLQCSDLHKLAGLAWIMAKAGKIHLTQRRLPGATFEYIATVAHPAGVDQ